MAPISALAVLALHSSSVNAFKPHSRPRDAVRSTPAIASLPSAISKSNMRKNTMAKTAITTLDMVPSGGKEKLPNPFGGFTSNTWVASVNTWVAFGIFCVFASAYTKTYPREQRAIVVEADRRLDRLVMIKKNPGVHGYTKASINAAIKDDVEARFSITKLVPPK